MYEYQLSSDALAWYTIMATCMLVSDIQLSIPKKSLSKCFVYRLFSF